MANLLGLLGTLQDLALVIVGFGLIILIHELGHFVAARWAGIRVLAFAIGFGPAALSYRKGIGLRRGSTENAARGHAEPDGSEGIGTTEYRLNWFPLGGYVKMLGQEDLDPGAVSDAPDSYQRCKPWKRLVVISAGVVMNLVLAAGLFVLVFMLGIQSEPAKVGLVERGSPASEAVATNAERAGVERSGLMPGDEIVSVDGRSMRDFNALNLRVVMAAPGQPLDLRVARPGVEPLLRFEIEPEKDPYSGLLRLGIGPAFSTEIPRPARPWQRRSLREGLARVGLGDVPLGSTLVEAGGHQIRYADELEKIAERSGGGGLELVFETPDMGRIVATVDPVPEYQRGVERLASGEVVPIEHLAGLTAVMRVAAPSAQAADAGLQAGDVFVRVGSVEYPSLASGIVEIRAHAGRQIDLTVERAGEDGAPELIDLTAEVGADGQIGFEAVDTAGESSRLGTPVEAIRPIDKPEASEPSPTPIAGLAIVPGSRLVEVGGTKVSTLHDARHRFVELSRSGIESGEFPVVVPIVLELAQGIGAEGEPATREALVRLDRASAESIAGLGWTMPFSVALFEPEHITLRAGDPLHAIGLGLAETHRVMLTTYLTFARLFQGTVEVRHLKGPVGIAHLGTRIAERGLIWLLFFLALISVNLAVINLRPLPIVDGGQFLMILYEQIRGRPVPIAVQNVVTLAGLVLIATVFLVVTYHDIAGLFGG